MSKNYAICVGIDRYNNLQPLQYAVRDAGAVRDFCLQEKFDQVYFFAVNAPPIPAASNKFFPSEPTFGNLEGFLEFRFAKPFLKPEDNLWFFFAGHGRREGGKDYLLPSDFTGNVSKTGLAIREIGDRLRNSGAGNVVMFLDACRNEASRRGEGIGLEQQQGVVSIFACSPNQYSYEIEALQHGAFTYSLLQGLRITGEGNCATVERLNQYLIHQVPLLCQKYQKPLQTPYIITEPASKLHLILLPDKANMSDVTELKLDAFEAEIEGDLDLAETLWIRVLASSKIDYRAIKALQRIAIRRNIQTNHSVLIADTNACINLEKIANDYNLKITDRIDNIDSLVLTEKIWEDVLNELKPPTTHHLFRQQAKLLEIHNKTAFINIKNPPLLNMCQSKSSQIESAFEKVLGYQVRVNISVNPEKKSNLTSDDIPF